MTERETEPTLADGSVDDEVPVEDALEQRADVTEREGDAAADSTGDATTEADEADRAEQGRVVDTDDDEYR